MLIMKYQQIFSIIPLLPQVTKSERILNNPLLKILLALSLVCLSFFTISNVHAARQIIQMPLTVQNQICKQLSGGKPCPAGKPLSYLDHFKMDNDRLLLFFYLTTPDGIYRANNTLPVKIDLRGNWTVGKVIQGSLGKVTRDPQGGIWLHTQNASGNNTSPLLYHSKNGIDWKAITLPDSKQVDCCTVYLKALCFEDNTVRASLQNADDITKAATIKSWRTDTRHVMTTNPAWQALDQKLVCNQLCQTTSAYNNAWVLEQRGNDTLFRHKFQNIVIKLNAPSNNENPATSAQKSGFVVQAGLFGLEKNANQLLRKLTSAGYSGFTTTIDSSGRTYTKVYIGPFPEKNQAVKIRQKLMSKHNISGFITTASKP